MYSIFKILQELKVKSVKSADYYNIAALPSIRDHKIGISQSEYPMFFIKCNDSENVKSIDCNLEFISVQFNRHCQLLNNKKEVEEGIYTIISLKTNSIDLQEYFLDTIYLVIKKLPQKPNLKELKIEVDNLLNLFNRLSQPAIKTIQGLWAELLIIEQSNNPEYLIKAWHSSATDKFDFNDGKDKIEVKSTSNSRRVHTFSIEQLNPNEHSTLLVASVFTVMTGIGKSIFNLIHSIEKKLKNKEGLLHLNEIVVKTLGKDFEKSFDVFYDYQLGIDSIEYFKSADIPSINTNNIPREISNIRFDCDLTNLSGIKENKTNSILHNSLFQNKL